MTIVEALKELANKMIGTEVDEVPGDEISEVIKYIADNYQPSVMTDEVVSEDPLPESITEQNLSQL